MKVLVISHNVFSKTDGMGKTLSSYFAGFSSDELAQFYIHSQVPTTDVCLNYYRITDKEAIKSIFGSRVGRSFGKKDIDYNRVDSRTDNGFTGTIYQKARKRTPIIYFVRNIWWKLARWNTKKFKLWIDSFQPECVFLASGDYAFIYDIALQIAKSRNIPLYVSCMDDYYLYNKNAKSCLGRLQHHLFMKSVNRTMKYATKLFCICEKMSEDYSELFQKTCITIHTPAVFSEQLSVKKKCQISYLGNLGYNRDKQLIDIGKALKTLGLKINHIDVYSSESRPEILSGLTEENGLVFHGAIGADEVLRVMGESLAVIHTESFEKRIRCSVRYSVSTKIADSLMSGTCIFAYGPEEIASIDYLKKNEAAVCCSDKEKLKEELIKLIEDSTYRSIVERNAVHLAHANHSNTTKNLIRQSLES